MQFPAVSSGWREGEVNNFRSRWLEVLDNAFFFRLQNDGANQGWDDNPIYITIELINPNNESILDSRTETLPKNGTLYAQVGSISWTLNDNQPGGSRSRDTRVYTEGIQKFGNINASNQDGAYRISIDMYQYKTTQLIRHALIDNLVRP